MIISTYILCLVYQIITKFDVLENDVMLNCLPMFHSFGLTAGTVILIPLTSNDLLSVASTEGSLSTTTSSVSTS